jgi:copper chaperone CopZ
VTRALSDLDGVESVEIDLAVRGAKVQYDAAKVSLETMGDAIRDAGYDVEG